MQQLNLKLTSVREHHFFGGQLNADSTVVDFGAHLGEFSSQVSKSFKCKCYAVEALPSLYAKIVEDTLVTKFNYAITNYNKPININISPQNPEGNSIFKEVADAVSKKWPVAQVPSTTVLTEEVLTVEGITLETFLNINKIQVVDLLKVDIEGAEVELFSSTKDETFCTRIKQITIEFHDFIEEFKDGRGVKVADLIKRLESLGFFSIVFSIGNYMDVLLINTRLFELSKLDRLNLWYIKNFYSVWSNRYNYAKLAYRYIKGRLTKSK